MLVLPFCDEITSSFIMGLDSGWVAAAGTRGASCCDEVELFPVRKRRYADDKRNRTATQTRSTRTILRARLGSDACDAAAERAFSLSNRSRLVSIATPSPTFSHQL